MEQSKTVPWYSENGKPFRGKEPYFYDPDEFSWVSEVESNFHVIRDELKAMLAQDKNSLAPYMNGEMTSRPNTWKTFGMMFWTMKSDANADKCPKTWEILKGIPYLSGASFNMLEPNTTIKPHHGDTDAIIRCHMGLDVPAPAPKCGFRVGTETKSWEDGKFLMFCDAYEHTAWNNTDRQRYILVVDIIRPEFAHKEKSIVANVLASIKLEVMYQKSKLLQTLGSSKFGKIAIFSIFKSAIHAVILLPGSRRFD